MPKKRKREMVRFGSVIGCATLAGASRASARNQMVTRARFAGQLRCLALAKLRFAANARPPASKKNPNPRKINDLRSSDRRMAAPRR
jgi:hypothetical protein